MPNSHARHDKTVLSVSCLAWRCELAFTVSLGLQRGVVVSGVRRMNEVNPRLGRLVPGWVTVFGRVYNRLGM